MNCNYIVIPYKKMSLYICLIYSIVVSNTSKRSDTNDFSKSYGTSKSVHYIRCYFASQCKAGFIKRRSTTYQRPSKEIPTPPNLILHRSTWKRVSLPLSYMYQGDWHLIQRQPYRSYRVDQHLFSVVKHCTQRVPSAVEQTAIRLSTIAQ